jgi:hypothetical protein
MKSLLTINTFFFFLFFNHSTTFGQINPNAYYEKFNDTPKTKELTLELTKGLENDSLKLLVIYDWIVKNIKYDSLLLKQRMEFQESILTKTNINIGNFEKKPVHGCLETLTKRKTICQGFANLMSAMCSSVGIPNMIIKGYGRTKDKQTNIPNHVWIAFKLSKWYLSDPTWDSNINDAGYSDLWRFRHNFLMIEADEFLKSHYPLDPLWQMKESPISFKNWLKEDFNSDKSVKFSVADSLNRYDKLNQDEKFLSSVNRIIKSPDYAWMGHFEMVMFILEPMIEEMYEYQNINNHINKNNKSIYDMAKKMLPRKQELLSRLAKIENFLKKFDYHIHRLNSTDENVKRLLSVTEMLKEIRPYEEYLNQEKESLTSTIRELEKLPKPPKK